MSGGRKPLVRVFLSVARLDEAVARRLWERLAVATAVDRVYEFELWRFDQALLVGDDWDACIREALAASDVGVLALSDAFLGSDYITGVELPALVDVPGKHAVPLALRQISPHADMRGLEHKQIYGHQRPFETVRGQAAQTAWVHDLVNQIHRVLARASQSEGAR
ncbi:TIR domain-containing protein [Lentzea sp. BCCO 10_0856]|uniref:TIR domain-containing protein n=1 Tax=Lentzea miocenica TaxID=3095431 RepID=A0ABU4TCW9_9PSEU|nr:TIR domain-containing protein [Lentzea sp. BCCO 10_0856]MDX8035738.1 TIR domain-containing protein [Lentzea sp. BCCO 10_0856]